MKRFFNIISLVILAQTAYGQAVFQRSYGGSGNEYGRAVIECSSGGYLIVGSTSSYYNPSTDVYLLRVNENGDYLWGKNIGETNKIDWGIDLAEDIEGNFIIAGYTDDSPSGSYDGLLIKTDPAGEVMWKKTYGDDDWDFFEGMVLNNENEIVLAGSKTVNGIQKGWILKTDIDGEIVWETLVESSSQLKITGVDICDDQSIVFIGFAHNSFLDTKKFVAGNIINNGEIHWVSSDSPIGKVETGKCFCGNNNSFYSVGTVFSSSGEHDIFANSISIDSGTLLWNNSLGQTDAFGNGIMQQENGDVYFVGTINGIGYDSYTSSINSYSSTGGFLGEYKSTAILGGFGTDEFFDLISTLDGGMIAVGETNSFGNGYQVHLCKLDSIGTREDQNTDFLDLATAINPQITLNEIKIFPNPAQHHIQVNNEHSINYTFNVFGIDGRQFLAGNIKDQPGGIDIHSLPSGLFILKLYESGELKAISRFVKLP